LLKLDVRNPSQGLYTLGNQSFIGKPGTVSLPRQISIFVDLELTSGFAAMGDEDNRLGNTGYDETYL